MVKLTKKGILRINFRNSPYKDFRLRCNFKCSYCFERGMKVKKYTFTKQHFQQTKSIWDELATIDDHIHIRINFQGETLIDKWAKECAFYINKIHNVKVFEIVTNNSVSPNAYLHNLDLTKSSFNCSFHPEFMSLKRFIENVLTLKKAGCAVFVNVVCIPQIIQKIPKIYSILKKYDICLKLQGFNTPCFTYIGKKYPKDFTAEERRILQKYFYSKEEYEYMINLKRTKGLDCFAGVDMINVFLNGSVRRCFTGEIWSFSQKKANDRNLFLDNIGNTINKFSNSFVQKFFINKIGRFFRNDINVKDLVSGKIKLKNEPYPCHENFCACNAHFIGLKEFREKYPLSDKFVDNYEFINKPVSITKKNDCVTRK